MLGLIAFALLILACSYWKLSGYLENRDDGERDLEAGEAEGGGDGCAKPAVPPVMEEKFLVIMAGQEKPTFLATPMWSRASSFGSKSTCSSTSTSSSENTTVSSEEDSEEKNMENSGQIEMGNMAAHESAAADQVH